MIYRHHANHDPMEPVQKFLPGPGDRNTWKQETGTLRREIVVESTPPGEQSCPICHGRGFLRKNVSYGHPQFGQHFPCECTKRQRRVRAALKTYTWLGASPNVVKELESMAFENFAPQANGPEVRQGFRRARIYAAVLREGTTNARSVLFLGPYGVGKTHLACAILNTARTLGIPCLFMSGNMFFQRLYSSGFDESYLDQAITTDILCLDDLDKMQIKEDGSYQKTTLFTLFDQRYLAGKPTIITANKGEGWKQWLDGSVISRLLGSGEVIEMVGQDYRLLGRQG